jgi:hypothetical protein
VQAIKQRGGYAILISTAGLIQDKEKFSTTKNIQVLELQVRATVYFKAGKEGLRLQHHAVKWLYGFGGTLRLRQGGSS